jgi:hypothetical protein
MSNLPIYDAWNADRARIEELEQQLAERERQIVMLRTALDKIQWGDFHFDHNGDGQHYCPECGNLARQSHAVDCPVGIALAATADLSGCIICDAEPVRFIYRFVWYDGSEVWRDKPTCNGSTATETVPLYKAK